jgi:hypothetical protein
MEPSIGPKIKKCSSTHTKQQPEVENNHSLPGVGTEAKIAPNK